MNKGLLVSLEGISGCGKTYLTKILREKMEYEKMFFVSEVSDRTADDVDKKIIDIIRSSSNGFFQNGIPFTETLLLLALKVFDFEKIITEKLKEGFIVFEDRSIDTIAVYQSIIINNGINNYTLSTAKEILKMSKKLRKIPDITFLITDSFQNSIDRAEKRNKRNYNQSELNLLKNADSMYESWARNKLNSDRIKVLNRKNKDLKSFVKVVEGEIRRNL